MSSPTLLSGMDILETIRMLQQELAETNREVMALTLELEDRVIQRTAELRATQEELQRTNSELMQMTIELEGRVAERTEELESANQVLRRHRDVLQEQADLINLSRDAIIRTAPNRVITGWNSGAAALYGWNGEEAVGSNLYDLLQSKGAIPFEELDAELHRKGWWDGELVQLRRNGNPVTVDSRQLLIRDSHGAVAGILEINRDITERRLLEDQLRQAQKMESIGQLAGGVAHDFNNLLTVITGYAEMIMEELSNEHFLYDPAREIYHASERASALTRQLLAFSRRQNIEQKPVVINDLVRNLEKMLGRLIGEDIDLILTLDRDAGVLRADPGQIEQVVINLVVNARDAMPSGGKIVIETGRLFADEEFSHMHVDVAQGNYVLLGVSDTGSGMTPEVQKRAFEPFFTTKGLGKGTGLGLSTVYGIVKQSGGSISIYSEPGHGTSFKMLFPAVDTAEEQVRVAPTPLRPSQNETILLAEDEEGVRKFIRNVLERHGYQVLEAPNGAEALGLLQKHADPIHLLLTDVVMPELNGPELAQHAKLLRPGMPVLYMSGYNDRLWRPDDGPRHFVQKPFPAATLLTSVQKALTP